MMATDSGHRRFAAAPLFYTIKQVQRAAGMEQWSSRRIRRWLGRAGALERRYGTVVTTPERLAIAFPEIYRRLLEADDDEEEDEED